MKKMNLLFVLSMLLGGVLCAQTMGEIELKDASWGEKKLRKADKKIYIAEFEINYQLLADFSETAEGGRQMGGSYRGDATARLVLGVPGIDEKRLQENTNNMYNMYVAELEAAGFKIVTPEEAGKSKIYADWERLNGGTPSMAQNPGYIQTIPEGFGYFKQKINKKGRAKTSIFYSIQLTKLSKSMDNTIIAMVKMNVPIFEDAESGISKGLTGAVGGVAKVVARANFRIAESIYIETNKMGGGESIPTQVTFLHPEGAIVNYLKKDAPILGVFDNEKKYKASESASVDYSGTSMGALRIFNPDDKTMENMQSVECDPDKFIKGAELATSGFIKLGLTEFLTAVAPKK